MLERITNWLGLAAKETAAPEAPDTREIGVTGTPIFGGFVTDAGEYNAKLAGLGAFATYEQMRRGDAQVSATLLGMKLPIRRADWNVVEPENASPVEKEATEFVREELLEAIDLDDVVSNALLMLDFGVAAHEDVYKIDGNRVRIAKLAARLPLTFNRWITAPGTDELVAIEQTGYRAGSYLTVQVPVDRLAIFSHGQEGANFAGRSIMRAMYQHWYIKSNLYKIDAISIERNGMGIPWIELGENSKAEDRKECIAWMEKLSVHEKAALVVPAGYKFKLEGVSGLVRDPKEAIAHHNMQISMAGLAQFMLLGQKGSEGGNRALGQTMGDFFYLGLQATANKIARVMNLTTVKRLCDYNFAAGPAGAALRYPRLIPQEILSLNFDALMTALKELAAGGLVEPDDETEAWLRNKVGAPEKGTPRPRPAAALQTSAGGEPGAGKMPALPGPEEEPEEVAAASEHSERRAARGAERYLALDEMAGALDAGRDRIAKALRAARSRIQAEIVHKLVNAPVATMHRVSVAPDAKLIAEIEAALVEVQEFGFGQVEQERERQRAGRAPAEAAEVRAMADRKRKPKREPLGVYADGAVGEFTNSLTARAANVVLDLKRRPGARGTGEIIRDAEARLDQQSDAWVEGVGSKAANNAFADGRAGGAAEFSDEIQEVQYSSLLDPNTCEACNAADGQTGKTADDIPSVPNPDCLGGDRCRCVHVFVFAEETRAA